MHRAIEISEIKYPKEDGWRHMWVFDHSSCHAAMSDDALDVSKMNVKPGGKQNHARDHLEWENMENVLYRTGRKESRKGDDDGAGRTLCVNCGKNR